MYSAELEMTVNMLIQIDKLVQLLESPVFTCKHPMNRCRLEVDKQKIYDFSFSSLRDTLIYTNVSMGF